MPALRIPFGRLMGLVGGLVVLTTPSLLLGQPQTLIRVGILLGQAQATLAAEATLEVLDVALDRIEYLGPGPWVFRAVPEGIEGAGRTYGDVLRVRTQTGIPIRLVERQRAYRGVVELRRVGRTLVVVNEVDLESYLYGVLRLEVDPAWPPEALKAQAVAARTLALASLGRFRREGFDVRDTTEVQLYGGATFEDPRTNAAVDATRGVVLLHEGKPIHAVYHADSGGQTEASEHVWGVAYPYLRSVEDPYVAGSPYQRWTVVVPLAHLEDRLRAGGVPVQGITGIEILRTTESGRALALRILAGSEGVELVGTRLRSLLGPNVLLSTRFSVRVEGQNAIFEGSGWGHGVGLSQWGARGMALAGASFDRILRHYYRGVELLSR
ncbi:MAG: SpoIID/LytB domain-containing protein [Armatimonadetes bacterium]|nr:SpoIID/LytB domain-containing protein [Armatimonadota bacterium]MDW8153049.1 SpoIID/LytB domain-containing protein [Armatimonadota bacterium]